MNMTRNQTPRRGFTLVEIMIVITIIILLAAIAIPSFVRARQRTQGATTINGARLMDAAVDQWAIENGIDNGVVVNLPSIAIYIVQPGIISQDLSNGITPTDALSNEYVFGTVGPGQVQINPATKASLSAAVSNWGPY